MIDQQNHTLEVRVKKSKPLDTQSIRKQAIIRSIHQSIKSCKVSMILGKDVQPDIINQANDQTELGEMHTNVIMLRKQCDTYKTQSLQKEKEIQILKQEIEKLAAREQEYGKSSTQVQGKTEEAKQQFVEAKDKYDDAVQLSKSYHQILQRMQKDALINQSQLYELELKLQKKSILHNQSNLHQLQSYQFNELTQKMMEDVMKNVEQQHHQREGQLKKFKQTLKLRQENESKRDERHAEQIQIAEKALYEKDGSERKWLKLYFVHKFVQSILKTKIEGELKKFQVVEKAFQKIKTTTGISDAQEIVNKFLSREETYGELLSRISESEKRLDTLKKKNEEFNRKYNAIKEEFGDFALQKNNKKGGQDEQYKELQLVEDKSNKIELTREKSYNWAIKMLKKLEKIQNKKPLNYYNLYPRDKLPNLFDAVNSNIIDIISDIQQEEDVDQTMFDITRDQEYADESYTKKNIRVKAKKFKKKQRDDQSQGSKKTNDSLLDDYTDDENLDDDNENQHFTQIREEVKNTKK